MEPHVSEYTKAEKKVREEILDMIRSKVAYLGEKLSYLLVDFFFLVSDDDEQLVKNFESLSKMLEPKVRRGREMVVIDRIFSLLETGKNRLRDREKLKKLKRKAQVKIPMPVKYPEIINRFYERIIVLEDILSSVSRRPVVLWHDGYIRDFNKYDKELDSMRRLIDELGSFDNIDNGQLWETMSDKVEQLWIDFELDKCFK